MNTIESISTTPSHAGTLAIERSVLGDIAVPVCAGELVLASGRSYALEATPDGDRLTVRARHGQIVLRVLLTDAGPVLCFESADVELRAARSLLLASETIELRARSMHTLVTEDVCQHIGGARHVRIEGSERLEAATIEVQANEGEAHVRAAGRIALDGEHIGLNDDACPAPFAWSAIATAAEG